MFWISKIHWSFCMWICHKVEECSAYAFFCSQVQANIFQHGPKGPTPRALENALLTLVCIFLHPWECWWKLCHVNWLNQRKWFLIVCSCETQNEFMKFNVAPMSTNFGRMPVWHWTNVDLIFGHCLPMVTQSVISLFTAHKHWHAVLHSTEIGATAVIHHQVVNIPAWEKEMCFFEGLRQLQTGSHDCSMKRTNDLVNECTQLEALSNWNGPQLGNILSCVNAFIYPWLFQVTQVPGKKLVLKGAVHFKNLAAASHPMGWCNSKANRASHKQDNLLSPCLATTKLTGAAWPLHLFRCGVWCTHRNFSMSFCMQQPMMTPSVITPSHFCSFCGGWCGWPMSHTWRGHY